jgi:uncharacterized protein (TIGR02118 family)
MVKLVVGYGQPDDPARFDEHYVGTHIPLVNKIPNLRRFESERPTAPRPRSTTSRSCGSTTPSRCRRRWAVQRDRPRAPMWRRLHPAERH